MEFFEVVKTRRSIRRYLDQPVEEDKLQAVLEAVLQSPSWANMQCWRLVVIRDSAVRGKISDLSYVESFLASKGFKANPAKKALAEAPIVIILCADPSSSGVLWDQKYYLVDCGIAAQSLMLAARALELGTVFVGVFDEEKIKVLLGIPESVRVVGLFPLGYPAEERKEGPSRKPLSEISCSETWKL